MRLAILSAHLDDAGLSLGAFMHQAASLGHEVKTVTVFANRTASASAASSWDRKAGFATEGEAAVARRAEDHAFCEAIGVQPVHLDHPEEAYARQRSDRAIVDDIEEHAGNCDIIFAPGLPLRHADHRYVKEIFGTLALGARARGFYLEQPYAASRGGATGRTILGVLPSASHGSHWFVLRSGLRSHVVKQRALRAYRSQLPLLGPFCRARVGAFELLRRGETVCGGDDLVAALTHMEILR